MAISTNAKLSIILAVIIPIMVLVILILAKKVLPLFTKFQAFTDRLNQVVTEKLTGVRVIRAFGKEEYERAEKLAQSLFNNEFKNLTKQDIADLFDEQDMKNVESNIGIVDMVVNVGAASSKREAREFISSGAVSINGEKITDNTITISDDMFIDNTYIIIKRGKKNYYIGRK